MWTDLPEFVFEVVVELLQGDRKVSSIFRRVCHAWRDAHDRLVTVLRPNGVPQDARLWSKFVGMKTLYLKPSSLPSSNLVNDDALKKAPELFIDLTSLDLSGGFRRRPADRNDLMRQQPSFRLTDEGVRSLARLTSLTDLNLADRHGVSDEGVRA
jgi:hypothetical protein